MTLNWTAATDNVGVTSYGIYRDGLPIFNVENPDGSAPAPTSYIDANVPPGTYTYTVDAADAIGNRSGLSNTATITTAPNLAALPAGTVVNEPPVAPVQIISFPSRDFVSSSGFLATDTVQVQVLRRVDGQPGPALISTSTVIPLQDPRAAPNAPFAGIVEVNHPGGGCWDGVTPDIRVGDIIRTVAYNPDGTIRTVDQTTTANVIAERPLLVKNATPGLADGVVAVHGVAMYADGTPIDLAQFENRLIANRDLFVFNGRRVLRAGGAGNDGAISYDTTDPTGVRWTATYTGLVQEDVDRVLGLNGFSGAQSRALWLGVVPLAGLELTIYENDADPLGSGTVNGPAAAVCFAPSEPFDTSPPGTPSLAVSQAGPNSVQLSWGGAADNVAIYGYAIYQDGIRIRNLGAVTSFVLNNVPAGNHSYTVDAADAASPSAQLSPTFKYNSPWGNRSAMSNIATLGQPDVVAPSVPTNLVATSGPSKVALTWTASTDNIGVTSYGVYRGGVKVADVAAPSTTYTDLNLAVGTYTYTVDAADAAGNRSAQPAAVTANVTALADAIAPTVPTNLVADTRDIYAGATAPAIGPHDVKLSWTRSTDNVGVTGYGIYRRNTVPVGGTFGKVADIPASATPTYLDTPASIGTYEYSIDAFDSAANRSARSASKRAVSVNDPPTGTHSILPFPQRDFVSSTGYALSEGPVTVTVIRGGRTVATSTAISPVEDPATPGLGAVEVNHPGGGCWSNVTPNLLPGDIVRYTNAAGLAEQTRTR
ncbi:MAG: hypothetical protein E6I52_09725 [Chloroflexi bacterium]|nr:MAG: hypothetical protein E6I52_09725 [Chloroflexota bacterium]